MSKQAVFLKLRESIDGVGLTRSSLCTMPRQLLKTKINLLQHAVGGMEAWRQGQGGWKAGLVAGVER